MRLAGSRLNLQSLPIQFQGTGAVQSAGRAVCLQAQGTVQVQHHAGKRTVRSQPQRGAFRNSQRTGSDNFRMGKAVGSACQRQCSGRSDIQLSAVVAACQRPGRRAASYSNHRRGVRIRGIKIQSFHVSRTVKLKRSFLPQ